MTTQETMTADPPDYDDPDLARRVEAMAPADIDALPFGALRVDADGQVCFYSRREAQLSGRDLRPTVGLHFFTEIAPCMDTPLVRGRIERALAAGTLDVRLRHVGDFADRSRTLEMRALSAAGGGFWLFLRRV
ncbi:PAS domain-containing protein [Azohydromonas aeria]|uniref:PAS domain-containing protein n=1 Tax=Azohydromonas aeria TaxID=2590212 RepID=UPI0012F9A406|nr:PAS domain-containing protein [Azohydromonas aeria]